MTIETAESKKVSDAELLVDLGNTDIETEAVKKILEGYTSLQNLPENPPGKYSWEILKFQSYYDRCSSFGNQLRALDKERGLI